MHFVPDRWEIRYLHRLPGVRVAFSRWITSIGPNKAITIASCRKSDPYVAPPSLETPSPAPPPPPAAPSPRLSTPEPSSVPASQPFPPVERYSGQREGEEMEAFFLRRQEKNAQTAAREKPQEKQRREQKEANAQKGQVPGRKGARVYVWDKSNGHYIRRAAGRSNYDDVWEEYGPDQRRYDSFHDEWDVCEQFGAPAEVEDWDGSDGYGGEEDDDGLSEMLPHDVVLAPSAAHTSEADLDRNFHLPFLPKNYLAIPAYKFQTRTRWTSFVFSLRIASERTRRLTSPVLLLDFHQKDSELYSDWAVHVRTEVLNDQVYYVISEKEQQSHSLFIVVQSAANALETVRQGWGPSITDVAENLLSRGVSFMTCCRSTITSPAPLKPQLRSYSGLGYRPPNYKPDMRDYQAYVEIRQRFMSSPRGRAALLYGGIVGRLARSEASKEEALRGPSDDALVEGICLWDGRSPFAYWDDCLTQQEIDLICGVYHVATGEFSLFFFDSSALTIHFRSVRQWPS
ncbi:hypothetical protein DFH06DRAFT_979789 [Mycena polygramma]|nr:hypothetical protein DFH06DRAFT_979789 [Mycena polygramma]